MSVTGASLKSVFEETSDTTTDVFSCPALGDMDVKEFATTEFYLPFELTETE
jgi:hypothetical protein